MTTTTRLLLTLFLILSYYGIAVTAFVSPNTAITITTTTKSYNNKNVANAAPVIVRTNTVQLNAESNKKKSKKPFDEGLRTKLVSESIAPWRTLRLFLYGALGSGAALGGFITATGVAAALSGARNDVDLNTEVCVCYV